VEGDTEVQRFGLGKRGPAPFNKDPQGGKEGVDSCHDAREGSILHSSKKEGVSLFPLPRKGKRGSRGKRSDEKREKNRKESLNFLLEKRRGGKSI